MNDIWIDTPQGQIFGRTAGDSTAPLILGIHGWSQRNGWHTWEPLLAPLSAAGYRVIALDMPGWGQSDKWAKTAGQSAITAVLNSLGVDKAKALMGKSWGGGVSVAFALTFPERVEKLILTAPAVRGGGETFGRLTQPVLLAWAGDDPVIPIQNGRDLVQGLPTCEWVQYPTGGHNAAPENAVDFAAKAITFLQK